jgi:cytochrome c oxidase assembly protein subunit 15
MKPDRLMGMWYLALCGLVCAMILVGGATRLTDSGLSITEWNFAKQIAPPLSDRAWAEEFGLYQQTTEFRLQNSAMTLGEFKIIYWWEWGHRFLGKVVGLVWALGFVALLAAGRLRARWPVALAMGALGGAQGAIGWWMVTSGLWSGLDVSPVRLAAHLGMAFLILGIGARLTLHEFSWPRTPGQGALSPVWRWGFLWLVFLQILAGAIVAGSDAGRAYQDWPLIGGRAIPPGYTPLTLTDHAAIQFTHRTLGYLVVAAALAILWVNRAAPPVIRKASHAMAGLTVLQMLLGIATILLGAPLWISLAHQGLAVLLWVAIAAWMHAHRAGYPDTTHELQGAQGLQSGA